MKIPKLRAGAFFPPLLEPRRRIDVALHAVVMQAWVEGVDVWRVLSLLVQRGGHSMSAIAAATCLAPADADEADRRHGRGRHGLPAGG